MKDALTQTCAAPGAHRAGRAARLVRAAAVGLALVAGGAVHAQNDGYGQERRDDPRLQQQLDPRFQRPPEQARDPRIDPRMYDSREFQERRQQMQQEQSARRSGRLTPDERRDLRRQINEAGQDLYPPRRR